MLIRKKMKKGDLLMKSFKTFLLFAVILNMAIFAFADREISGTVTCNTLYIPDATNDLEFVLDFSSPDVEWVAFLELTFPAGMTPTGTPDAITGGTNTLQFNQISGQAASWGAGFGDTSLGYLSGTNAPFTFSLQVEIDAGISGEQIVAYHAAGDDYGSEPHEFSGECIVSPALDNDLRAVGVTGNVTPTEGVADMYHVTVFNQGQNNAASFEVELFEGEGNSIGIVNATDLSGGEYGVYDFTFIPETSGATYLYAIVNWGADENTANNTTPNLNINVQQSGTAAVVIGEDTTSANTLPLNFYWKNSISQVIYMAEELNIGGMLTAIMYHNSFTEDLMGKAVKIWVAETDQSDLSGGWLPYSEFTPVFDGVVDFPTGQNEILIPLDEYYAYGGQNLVIMANRVLEDVYWASSNHFYYTETPDYPNRALWYNSDSNVVDPENIEWAGTPGARVPNTTLFFATAGMGSLDGYVHSAEERTPLEGVEVKVLGTNFTQYTNADGYFIFPYVFEGTFDVQASLYGHYDAIEQNVTIVEDEVTSITMYMQQFPTVTVTGFVVGSDYPEVGLEAAIVSLSGYEEYEGETNENGIFTISGVYADNAYGINISYPGYMGYSGEIEVSDTDLDAGTFTLNEIASPVTNVIATQAENGDAELIWSLPGAGGSGEEQWIHYDDGINQDAIGTGGAADFDVAIRFTPEQLEDFDFMYLTKVNFFPYEASCEYSIRVWQGAEAANLLVDQLVPNPAIQEWNEVMLETAVQIDVAQELWIGYRANTQTGYPAGCDAGPAVTGFGDMILFEGAWASMNEAYGLNYNWNIQGWVSNTPRGEVATQILRQEKRNNNGFLTAGNFVTYSLNKKATASSSKNGDRALEMFKVYRMLEGQEDNEDLWIELGDVALPDTTYTETGFDDLPSGVYRFAVKAIYTNDVIAPASFSNTLAVGMHAHVSINISSNSGDPVEGAIVTLTNQDGIPEHMYMMEAPANGVTVFPMVWKGVYDVDVTLGGFQPHHNENVDILTNTVVYYAQLIEALMPVVNLQWSIEDHNINLTWLQPGESTEGDEIEEDFESGDIPAGWLAIDNDNDGYNWFAYEYDPHGGAWSMASASWWQNVVLTPDNFLVSPQLELGGNQELRFWAAAQDPAYPSDHYKVKLSTTGTNPSDFNVVLFEETLASEVWHEVVIDLSPYAGQMAYIAWEHTDSVDWFVMKIDDISVMNVVTREVTFSADFEDASDFAKFNRSNPKYRTNSRELLGYKIYRNGSVIVENTQELSYTDYDLTDGTYVYGVKALYSTGSSETINTEEISLTDSDEVIAVEYITELQGNYPNPFNPVTFVNFSLAKEAAVSVDVYNIKGQKVKTLVNDIMSAGIHKIEWNGKDDSGKNVASGIYFSKMRSGRYTSTKKMILMK
jgi:hypothetical protein